MQRFDYGDIEESEMEDKTLEEIAKEKQNPTKDENEKEKGSNDDENDDGDRRRGRTLQHRNGRSGWCAPTEDKPYSHHSRNHRNRRQHSY